MKLRLFFSLLCLSGIISLSAQENKKGEIVFDGINYRINGVWENGDGQMVYLSKEIKAKEYEVLDSAVVENGKFILTGKSLIDRRILTSGDQKKSIILTGEPIQATVSSETKEVRGITKTFIKLDIKGDEEQKITDEASKLELGLSFLKFGTLFAISQVKDDSLKVDSLYRMMQYAEKEYDEKIRKFVENNINSYAITYMIGSFIARDYPFSDVEYYYGLLPERIKASNPGKLLEEKIALLRHINVGGLALDIEEPSPLGAPVKLSYLRGKYVLLDFWASWCKPCLAELPNIKEIYHKYRDKGFEIYSVSLDEKKELWERAIQKYEMNWVHVSSLKGWNCPVAAKYNVTGVPKMFLLDPEGKIIAVDLRGEELKVKVASLFN